MGLKSLGYATVLTVTAFLLVSCYTTTKSSEGTSKSIGNTSESTTKFTSSTSDDDDDDEAKSEQILQFARVNYDRLRSDMAMGQGEYLTSLGVLMEIDQDKKNDFYAMTKNRFDRLFVSADTSPEEMIANLQLEASQL